MARVEKHSWDENYMESKFQKDEKEKRGITKKSDSD